MSRTKGTYTLTSNIEPKVGAPLDARTVVKLKTDLTANNTFPYPYKGLTVFVEEENKKYTLIGSDTTNIDNWVEEGSATTGGHTIVDPESTALTQRTNLQFLDANVTDDSTDDTTVVENITIVNDESDITNAPDGIYMVDREETIDINADEVIYDNTDSGLQADNAQDAIDEVVASLGTAAYKDVPASGDAGFNQVVLGKDARLTYYDRNRYDAQVKCSTNIVEGNIIVGLNGLYHHLNDGTAFDITYPILYAKNNMAAGAANKSNYDSLAIDITITQQMTLTQFLPVYIKGRLSGNMFNPISTTPLTQEMVQDGYHYMLLGLASTTTNIYLFNDHRIFAHNGGSFCELIGNIGTAAYRDISASGDASTTQVVMGNDTRLTDARTPVSHTHTTSDITGLGTAATTNTTNNITQGGTDIPTAGAVWTAIDNLPEPMILKGTLGTGGTITSLPTAAADNEGFTYKVITDGTYASQAAKVGDFFVSCKPVGASAYEWIWFPSGDESFTDTWRNVKVNGTEQLGTGISSGAVDFVNGTNTTVAFDASGNKISVSVPAVSSTSAGVAPKGAAVSSQSQTTKFLREDGSWAAPSYTTDTNTTYTFANGTNGFTVTPSGGSAQTVTVTPNDSTKLPLAGGLMTGAGGIQFPTDSGASKPNNYISAGGGYSTASGKSGLKIISCEQADCVSGLGQDCGGGPYELSIITGAATDGSTRIRFLKHTAAAPATYTKLAELDGNGNFSCTYLNGVAIGSSPKFTDTTYNFGGTTFYSGNSGNAEHNANSIQYNGVYYYTSNGPSTAQGATVADGALYAEAYSTSWVGQIAQDYRNGNLWVRGKNNGTFQYWKGVVTDDILLSLVPTANKFLFNPIDRKIIANKSTSAWDAQVYSKNGYTTNCQVAFKPAQTNMAIMFGLDNNPAADANYNTIDYCWYTQNSGGLSIYENGTSISSISGHTTYAAGDDLRIEYANGVVKYYHNGVCCRSVARAVSGKLYVDSSFHGASGAIYDFYFGPTTIDASSVNGLTFSLVT